AADPDAIADAHGRADVAELEAGAIVAGRVDADVGGDGARVADLDRDSGHEVRAVETAAVIDHGAGPHAHRPRIADEAAVVDPRALAEALQQETKGPRPERRGNEVQHEVEEVMAPAGERDQHEPDTGTMSQHSHRVTGPRGRRQGRSAHRRL